MMKTNPLRAVAAAVACAAAGAAHAQSSVQIYGIVDVGLQVSDTGAPTLNRVTEIASGNSAGSRLGFRGSEDLGGGNKAVFNMEAGLANDTGAIVTFGEPNGTFFGRRSVVGLQGSWGELLLGREYTPAWQTVFRTDRFRFGLPGTIATSSGVVVTRANNGVFYHSPVVSGFRARLAATAGVESASVSDLGRLLGGTLEYRTGNLFLSASYQTRDDLVPGATRQTTKLKERGFGMDYDSGRFGLSSGYWESDPVTATAGAVDSSRAFWLGASMSFGPGKVSGQVSRTRIDPVGRAEGQATTWGLAYVHSLSKRTSLYAAIGGVRNDANTRLPLNTGTSRIGGVVFGADPRATLVGVRHDF